MIADPRQRCCHVSGPPLGASFDLVQDHSYLELCTKTARFMEMKEETSKK